MPYSRTQMSLTARIPTSGRSLGNNLAKVGTLRIYERQNREKGDKRG